jgi:hypothetical protein
MEISPLQKRVSYLAIMNGVNLLAVLLAWAVSALVRSQTETIAGLAIPAGILSAASFCFSARIEEPRKREPVGIAPVRSAA